jgi:predicted DNA-binding transcriptional regulator AlpA
VNLITQPQCRAKAAVKVTKWYELRKDPRFPKPVILPNNGTRKSRPRWIEQEIDAFLKLYFEGSAEEIKDSKPGGGIRRRAGKASSPTNHPEISLRDYFAAAALTGMLADPDIKDIETILVHCPGQCYRIADAMIKERSK